MLGLEHVTSRGSIMIEYYGRDIGVKIMPTGVNPDRFLEGFSWDDTLWRRGELLQQVCIPSNEMWEQETGWHMCTAHSMSTGSSASAASNVGWNSFCVILTSCIPAVCSFKARLFWLGLMTWISSRALSSSYWQWKECLTIILNGKGSWF